MKKFKLFFAAILLALVASCSSDQLDGTGSGGGVRFNVTLEGQPPQSRAVGDGTTATQLYYAVYETGTTTPLAVAPGTAPETMSGLTHTVNLSLVTGKTYDVVFWAQAPDAPYTFHAEGRTVDMNYNVSQKHDANDEKRDAFFNVTTFTVTGPMEQSVELRRPFAQLNFGTADFEKAHQAGFDPIATAVVVSSVYPTFSLVGESGALTGTPQEVEFELNYFNNEQNSIGSSIEIAGQSYTYLSMNYLLAKPESDVVDCSLYSYESPGEMFQLDLSNVPVQRNYRTNIYGNLLTSKTNFNVEIKPGFNAPAHNVEYMVRTASQLNEALNATASSGAAEVPTVTLANDLSGAFTVEAGNVAVLDLAGRTLTYSTSAGAPALGGRSTTISAPSTIHVKGQLTIIGSGKVKGGQGAAISVESNGKVVIEGGEYSNANTEALLISKADESATVEVKGGSFVGYDPTESVSAGSAVYSTTDENNVTTYHVVEGTVVKTAEEFKNAVENLGGEITVAGSFDLSTLGVVRVQHDADIHVLEGAVINTMRQDSYANIVINDGVSVNLDGEGEFQTIGEGETDSNSNRIIDINGKLVLNGCKFTQKSHKRGSVLTLNPGSSLIIYNTEINSGLCAIWNDSGNLVVYGGTIKSNASLSWGPGMYSYCIRAFDSSGKGGSRTVINGGYIEGIQGGVGVSSTYNSDVLEINGGTIKAVADPHANGATSYTFYAVYVARGATCHINGGEMSSETSYNACVLSGDEDNKYATIGKVFIKGGKFSHKAVDAPTGGTRSETVLPEGYVYKEISEGAYKYEVVKQ